MTTEPPTTAGIILCGGASRRMGQPKIWLPFGREMLLERMIRLVGQVTQPVLVVAAETQDLPSLPSEVILVRDEFPDVGPLAGLATGLAACADLVGPASRAFVTGCDYPLLDPGVIARWLTLAENAPVSVPDWEGHWQPLAGVYSVTLAASATAAIARGERSLIRWLGTIPDRQVLPAETWTDLDPTSSSLQNVNTPAAYRAVLEQLGLPMPSETWRSLGFSVE